MAAPEPGYVTLEDAKRQLTERLGISRRSLHNFGYVRELRLRGQDMGPERQADGSIRFGCVRVPVSAIDEVAAMAERGGPLPA